MSWCTTSDPDRFAAAAGGYLRSTAAENILLLSAAQAAGLGWRAQAAGQRRGEAAATGLLFGWWEPPDGGDPRGAFVHDPAAPLLISGMAPEMAAALAAALAKMGRQVCGVDAPTETADAFAAAWSQRAGATVRAHRNCRVYRLAVTPLGTPPQGTRAQGTRAQGSPAWGRQAVPGSGAWPPPGVPGPAGRLRVATAEDQALLADWLAAFAAEATERIDSPSDQAASLIGYGGAIFWEVPKQPSQFPDAAHYVEPAHQPVALATLTRPVAGTVRIVAVYTVPERRRTGYAAALTVAVSRALLTGTGPSGAPDSARGVLDAASGRVNEIVMITDKNRPDRWGGRFGYQLVSERAVLRFGPMTGPMPRSPSSGAMPRLPTGPLPRLPRLRR
jgi:hypothetical protein